MSEQSQTGTLSFMDVLLNIKLVHMCRLSREASPLSLSPSPPTQLKKLPGLLGLRLCDLPGTANIAPRGIIGGRGLHLLDFPLGDLSLVVLVVDAVELLPMTVIGRASTTMPKTMTIIPRSRPYHRVGYMSP